MGDSMNNFIKFINENNLGKIKENVSLKTLTTYKTGGTTKLLFIPNDVDSLKQGLKYLKDHSIKYKIFGNGSNILASDNNYNGVIIKLNNLNDLKIKDNILEVEAGYNLSLLCNKMCKEGYLGFAFGCGIPGTVGGSIYMNAGAYLEQISDVLEKVQILDEDFNFKYLNKNEMNFSYRHSIFMEKKYLVLKAYFRLEKGNTEEILKLIKNRKERRYASQPLDFPSAGSVFRNPENNYSGKLIEDLGLKGKTKGGAKISDKHANFIINNGNATSSDILYLMNLIHDKVKEKYNIDLHREQELFNFEEEE